MECLSVFSALGAASTLTLTLTFATLHPWQTLASSPFPFSSSFFLIFFLSGFFKGTSADQDRRFSDKELKLLKTIKFPPQFDTKVIIPIRFLSSSTLSNLFLQVDMRKVNLQVIRPWVAKKVVELVGLEDEVLVEYAMGLLEDQSRPVNTFHSLLPLTSALMMS